MEKINSNKLGLILGAIIGGLHLVWALLVWLGLAQGLLDWVFSLHFIVNPYVISSFNSWTMILLVVVTFIVGYIVGLVIAALINKFRKR